jgi:C4-dicarboxylate transporter, DctQ subunit
MLTRIFNRLEEMLLAFLLAAMVSVTFIQVTLRYLFGLGILWGVELTGYLFGGLVLLGASYVLKKRAHIGVDTLVQKLSPAWRRLLGIAATVLSLVYATIFFLGGLSYVGTMYDIGLKAEDMNIGRWILLSSIPIGYALLWIRLLQLTWRIWMRKEFGFYLPGKTADELRQLLH